MDYTKEVLQEVAECSLSSYTDYQLATELPINGFDLEAIKNSAEYKKVYNEVLERFKSVGYREDGRGWPAMGNTEKDCWTEL